MPLDPSILSQGKPFQTPDPLQNYSKILQIQAAQSQNALTQNQLGAAKRGEEGQNALSRAQQAAYDPETGAYDMNKLRGSMISGGFGALLPDVEKKMGDLHTQQLAQQNGRTKQFRDLLTNVNNPSAAAQWLQAQYKDPILGPVVSSMPLDQALAEIPTDPAKFNEWRSRNALGMEEFIKQNKPTTFETGTGQVTQRMSMPGLGGAATVVPGSTMQQVATPAQVEQGRRDQQQMAQSERHFQATPTVTQIVDPTDPNKMLSIDARRYQGGGAGAPGVIGVSGKEPSAALRQNKVEAGKTQLEDDLDNLRASFKKLDQMRAIPSTERGSVSNIGSFTAASGMGQMLGRAVGTEAQEERDVINSARMRLVNSIKNATGMSAQQLNSNVDLQTMLRSISDPGQSVQAALRIIDDIENTYVKGAGKLPKRGEPAAGGGNWKDL